MCNAWQTYGMWTLLGLGSLVGLAVGCVVGWKAHAFRQWHRRTMLHVQMLGPAIKLTATAIGTVLVIGFIAVEYFMM